MLWSGVAIIHSDALKRVRQINIFCRSMIYGLYEALKTSYSKKPIKNLGVTVACHCLHEVHNAHLNFIYTWKSKSQKERRGHRQSSPDKLSLDGNRDIYFVCGSYVSLLPAGLQQFVMVVLSHRRVHICELGWGVLQHGQGLSGIPFIQGLVDLSDGGNTWRYTSRHTNGPIKTLWSQCNMGGWQ